MRVSHKEPAIDLYLPPPAYHPTTTWVNDEIGDALSSSSYTSSSSSYTSSSSSSSSYTSSSSSSEALAISLVWDDNSDNELGFRVERREGEGEWMEIATTILAAYTDLDVVRGVEYQYRTCAYNEAGNSEYSNVITASASPLGSSSSSSGS